MGALTHVQEPASLTALCLWGLHNMPEAVLRSAWQEATVKVAWCGVVPSGVEWCAKESLKPNAHAKTLRWSLRGQCCPQTYVTAFRSTYVAVPTCVNARVSKPHPRPPAPIPQPAGGRHAGACAGTAVPWRAPALSPRGVSVDWWGGAAQPSRAWLGRVKPTVAHTWRVHQFRGV